MQRFTKLVPLMRTAVFTVLVPGVVAGYLPLVVIGGDGQGPRGWSYIGVLPVAIGLLIYAWTAFDFAWTGRGTPHRSTRRVGLLSVVYTDTCGIRCTSACCSSSSVRPYCG